MDVQIIEPFHNTQKVRLDFVDSLRGFAALYVVAYHTALIPHPILTIPRWLEPWLMNGGSGVTLFFVISAFTLCFTLDGKQDKPHSTRNFYVRRLFRILPLYYTLLIATTALQPGFVSVWANKFSLLLYIIFGYNLVPGHQEGLVWASWTLGIEMLFYFAFPIIFRFVDTFKKSLIFLIFSLFIAYGHLLLVQHRPAWFYTTGYIIHASIFYQLPVFAIGMVTYFIYKSIKYKKIPEVISFFTLITGVSLFFILPYLWDIRINFPFVYLMAIIYSTIFIGLSFYPNLSIVNRYSVFFGIISYSLYLDHPQLVYFLQPLYHRLYAMHLDNNSKYFFSLLITLIFLTIIAYITYRLIEKPMMDIAGRYVKK